jgi:hypothetical protein
LVNEPYLDSFLAEILGTRDSPVVNSSFY